MLKKLHVNIPFLDALSQMPLYTKLLKEILSKKRKVDEHETVTLGEDCSAVVLNQLLAKLKDLCDLGSSVSLMPYSIFKRLALRELRPTSISLQLVNRSIKYPLGVLKDVL